MTNKLAMVAISDLMLKMKIVAINQNIYKKLLFVSKHLLMKSHNIIRFSVLLKKLCTDCLTVPMFQQMIKMNFLLISFLIFPLSRFLISPDSSLVIMNDSLFRLIFFHYRMTFQFCNSLTAFV